MARSTSRAGNGQMIHLVVALAALTMDNFPFAHLGGLSDLPAQTPSPQDWAAVGMSPPRNPAKRQDTKDTPEAMRRRREQDAERQRRRRERHADAVERYLRTIEEKTAVTIRLTRKCVCRRCW